MIAVPRERTYRFRLMIDLDNVPRPCWHDQGRQWLAAYAGALGRLTRVGPGSVHVLRVQESAEIDLPYKASSDELAISLARAALVVCHHPHKVRSVGVWTGTGERQRTVTQRFA